VEDGDRRSALTMPLHTIFITPKPVIGMIHLPALPGSPDHTLTLSAIRDAVLRDAEALQSGGVDGFIVENFGDVPFYPEKVPPHTVACMTMLAGEIRKAFPKTPLGINVLRNDALSALAIAAAVDAAFIRVNIYTGARVADQGVIEGKAHEIMRYRKLLGSAVQVFADVAVKHSVALSEVDLADEVRDTVLRGRADAVIVSGSGTGEETQLEDVKTVKSAAKDAPVLAGSGASPSNVKAILRHADGLIVGTALKKNGVTTAPVDKSRVREFMKAVKP
jgi:uncharacterized protein